MADNIDGEYITNKNEKGNFWKEILNEVAANATQRLPPNKRLLVLGDSYAGKTSLISKLRRPGDDGMKKGAGLEYAYLDVHDEERDEHTRLNVWIQDGSSHYNNLLKYVFTSNSAQDLMIALCVDMSKPWNILDCLERWICVIREHLHSMHLPAKQLNAMEAKILKDFQDYQDFEETEDELKTKKRQSSDADELQLPLGENVLVNNLGIPIIVVVTKSDYMSVHEKERDYRDEHFDFIQKHIRQFCLRCGATLLYTSAKEAFNISLLYKYLIHRLYNFPLRVPPQVVEKDTIFIPMGWDNDAKISILDEHIKTFNSNDPLKEHITKPLNRKPANQEKEVIAEDEQTFLETQLVALSKAPAPSSSQRIQQPADVRNQRSPLSPAQRQGPRPGMPSSKIKMDPSKGAAAPNSSETVLANFFNSLLNKNTTGKGGKPGANPTASRSDVQAELERMSKKSLKKEANS